MKLLFQYLKNYKPLVFLALLLAAINQTFSFLDPYLLGRIIDEYVRPYKSILEAGKLDQLVLGVLGIIALAIGAAMVSRIAKNF